MYSNFLHIVRLLNEQLSVYPLLYGSLGLEKRLSVDLNADDIDVLIPEKYIKSEWNKLVSIMNADVRFNAIYHGIADQLAIAVACLLCAVSVFVIELLTVKRTIRNKKQDMSRIIVSFKRMTDRLLN